MNNNPYIRPYIPNFNNGLSQQGMYDQIDNQIQQLQDMKNQIRNNGVSQQPPHQPTAINQTFQLAPNGNGGVRYVNSIEDVNKETVFLDTPFFSKDMSVLWVKNPSGDIKAYELNEIVQKDEKDLQIEYLTAKLSELEGMIKNEQSTSNVNEPKVPKNTTTIDDTIGEPIEESKPTSIPRISKSKK